jgi:hypothetical protein
MHRRTYIAATITFFVCLTFTLIFFGLPSKEAIFLLDKIQSIRNGQETSPHTYLSGEDFQMYLEPINSKVYSVNVTIEQSDRNDFVIQVFFDYGDGFNEADSAKVIGEIGVMKLINPRPAKIVKNLRIDLTDLSGQSLSVSSMTINNVYFQLSAAMIVRIILPLILSIIIFVCFRHYNSWYNLYKSIQKCHKLQVFLTPVKNHRLIKTVNNKIMSIIIIVAILLTVILITREAFQFRQLEIAQNVKTSDATTGISGDSLIVQNFTLPDNFDSKDIDISVRIGTHANIESLLVFALEQGDKTVKSKVRLSDVVNNSFVNIRFHGSDFIGGLVKLSITADNDSADNVATIYTTEDTHLGKMLINGVESDVNVLLKISYMINDLNIKVWHIISYLILFVFFAIFVSIAVLKDFAIINIESLKKYKVYAMINFYFISTFIFVLILSVSKLFGLMTYVNQTYAETITNFFDRAFFADFHDSLTVLDAGYLPLLPRLLASILVKIFHVIDWYPVVTNLLTCFIGGLFFAIVNLHEFKKILDSDLLRFVICLFAVSLYGMHEGGYLFGAMHNIDYFGIIYLGWCALKKFEYISLRKTIIYAIGSLIIICSKATMTSLWPLVIVSLIFAIKQKNCSGIVYNSICVAALLIQSFVMINSVKEGIALGSHVHVSNLNDLMRLVIGAIIGYLNSIFYLIHLVLRFHFKDYNIGYIVVIAVFIGVSVVSFRAYTNRNRQVSWYFYAGATLCIGFACAMLVLTINQKISARLVLPHFRAPIEEIYLNRQSSVLFFVLLAHIMFIINYLEKWNVMRYIILAVLLCIIIIGSVTTDYVYKESSINGNDKYLISWDKYTYMLDRDFFSIPITPDYAWVYSRGVSRTNVNINKTTKKYALNDKEKVLLSSNKLTSVMLFTDPKNMYHMPINLVIDYGNDERIEVESVERKYLRQIVFDLYDYDLDNINSVSFIQNGHPISVGTVTFFYSNNR